MYCRRHNAKMMVRACLERQASAGIPGHASFTACVNCPDGERAEAGEFNDDDLQKILTEKREELAMAEDGKKMEDGEGKMEKTTKTCAKCKVAKPANTDHFSPDKKNRDGFRSYCKPCTAAKYQEYQEKKKKALTKPESPTTSTKKLAVVKRGRRKKCLEVIPVHAGKPAENVTLIINFEGHTDLLEGIKDQAQLAFRPVEMQILFMISEAAH